MTLKVTKTHAAKMVYPPKFRKDAAVTLVAGERYECHTIINFSSGRMYHVIKDGKDLYADAKHCQVL